MNIKVIESNKTLVNKLHKELNIPTKAAELLVGRGFDIETIKLLVAKAPIDERITYLENFNRGAELILSLLEKESEIYIFGDYDSDGINATYIMYNALNDLAEAYECGCKVYYYIPERSEGYGLNTQWCKDLIKTNKNIETLVVTVDNGISKGEEVQLLLDNNINVLVTDHHKPQEGKVPNCIVIDAHLNEVDDINKCGLCGAAVAYKFISYLYNEVIGYEYNYAIKYKVHAGIATITDMMPVTDENIILIKNTMHLLNSYPYSEMIALPVSESMNYFAEYNKGSELTPKDIAFGLGPQLNSCGRLGNTQLAIQFMNCTEYDEIEDLYNRIVTVNDERKEMKKAFNKLIQPPTVNDFCVVQYEKDFKGLAGNIANDVMARFNMVTVMLTGDGETVAGSARSPLGIDLVGLLTKERKLGHIIDFGGHANACGLEIKKDMIDTFRDSLNKQILRLPIAPEVNEDIYVDRIVNVKELSSYTINQYKDIMFFNDFKKPVFYAENVSIDKVTESRNNPNNICFFLNDSSVQVPRKIWSWGFGETYKAIGKPEKVNLVFTLENFKGMLVADIYNIEAC